MKHPADSNEALGMNIQFIDYIVYPLWDPLARFIPQQQKRVDQLQANRTEWLELIAERKKAAKKLAKKAAKKEAKEEAKEEAAGAE